MMLANQNLAQMVVSYMFQAPFVSTMIPQNQVLAWLVTKAMKQDKRLSVVAY